MPNQVGVYLEESAFHITEISGKFSNFKVTKYVKIPFENLQEGVQKLAEALKASKIKGKICVGLPFNNCIFRTFNIPYTDKQKVSQVVKFETENHVHPHTAEELVIEHEIISVGDKSSKVGVHAILKGYLAEILNALTQIKLNPEIITTDAIALYHTALENPEFSQKGNSLIVLPGKKQTRLITLSSRKISQLRTLRFGCEEEDYQERLIREVQRGSLNLTESLEEIGILGNPELADRLNQAQEDLGCPTISITPTLKYRGEIDEEALKEVGWIPIYIARSGFEKDSFNVNFRKGKYSKETPFSTIQIPLFCCFMWFIVLCNALGFYYQNQVKKQTPRLNQITKAAELVAKNFDIKVPKTAQSNYLFVVKRKLQGKIDEMMSPLGGSSQYVLVPALELWKNTSKAIESVYQNFGLLRFEQFLIKQNRFYLKGKITTTREIQEVIKALQKVDNLTEVAIEGRIVQTDLDLFRFQIKGKVGPN